jgi:hypothetical protein
MNDATERLAQAMRDLISEAVQAAVERARPTPVTEESWDVPRCYRHG